MTGNRGKLIEQMNHLLSIMLPCLCQKVGISTELILWLHLDKNSVDIPTF